MSVRRFMVLVRGLGPHSATLTKRMARRDFGQPAAHEVGSAQEAENSLAAIHGRKAELIH